MTKNPIIYSKTKDYIKTLLETDEVKAHKKAVKDFENDLKAKKLLSDYQETQRTYAVFQQGGFDGMKEQEVKFKGLDDEISKNHTIQSLIKTQRNLQLLVSDLVSDISEEINFPFARIQRSGCC